MRSINKRRRKKRERAVLGLLSLSIILLSMILVMDLDIGIAKSNEEQKLMEENHSSKWNDSHHEETPESTNEPQNESRIEDTVDGAGADTEQDASQNESESDGDSSQAEPNTPPEETVVQDEEHTVYLTFDDGPNENTEDILNVLDQYDAKATFFMLEPKMRRYSDSVKEMADAGHSMGMHGVTHDAAAFYQSSQSVVDEMKKAQSTLETITGIHSNLIRVPYGSVPNMTPGYRQAVDDAGLIMWDWNIDSEDWRLDSEEYVPNVMEQINSFPYKNAPKIILMHEKDITLAHLDELLRNLTEKGYEMKAITEQMSAVTF